MMSLFDGPKDLLWFLAEVEAGSISRASRQLDMTQPALTRVVARLEMIAGTRLLVRHSRGVTLNPFRENVAEEARYLLQMIEAAEARLIAARAAIERLRLPRPAAARHPMLAPPAEPENG